MRSTLLTITLLTVISSQMMSQRGFCPDTPELGSVSEHWLEGAVGSKEVRMYVATGGKACAGVFYFTDDWLPVLIGGKLREGGGLEMSDMIDDSPGTGRLKGRLTVDRLAGSWTPPGSSKQLPVRLKEVPRPDCGTATGKWLRFDDPQWPITFSYPASWRLESSNDSVTLVCPDPSMMAYESFNVTLSHGAGEAADDIGFTRCSSGWYDLRCDCDDLTGIICGTAAPLTEQNGMTIINGDDTEWRGYCRGGGYLGQVFGHHRVFLFDGTWVRVYGEGPPSELIDRIAGSIERR